MSRNHSSSKRRFWWAAISIVVAATVLGACGIPEDDQPREIDPALLENIRS